VEDGPSTVIPTLGFWLWIGGADIPIVWSSASTCHGSNNQTVLPSLMWAPTYGDFDTYDDIFDHLVMLTDYDYDTSDDEMFLTGELEQDLSGHLRKEIYSRQRRRMLRQGQHHKAKKLSGFQASDDKEAGSSEIKRNRTSFRQSPKQKHRRREVVV